MNEFLPEDYKKRVKAAIRKEEVWLGDGKADTLERYREKAGFIKGLKEAINLFNKILGETEDE